MDRRSMLALLAGSVAGCGGGSALAPSPPSLIPSSAVPDVIVYGATPSGIMAAMAARRSGASVTLLAPDGRVGGMVTGGLARTDYKGFTSRSCMNKLTREFYSRVAAEYGKTIAQLGFSGASPFAHEPKVAAKVYREMLAEAGITPLRGLRCTRVQMLGTSIDSIEVAQVGGAALTIRGRMFIDASYECDLMMRLPGLSWTYGREANNTYGEQYNGVRALQGVQSSVSPHLIAGDLTSGLLPFIEGSPVEPAGSPDTRLQAFNFRLVMTNDPGNRRPVPEPAHYDPQWYELLGRLMVAAPAALDAVDKMFSPVVIPSAPAKFDFNNRGGISTDLIGGNAGFVTLDYAARDAIVQRHLDYTLGLFKFLREDPRVPATLRADLANWGLCADEFTDENSTGMSPQLYIRESARLVGEVVMTEAHYFEVAAIDEPVAFANYNMDFHYVSRRNVAGVMLVEGALSGLVSSSGMYGIDYRCVLPMRSECTNLLVSCNGISASHAAFGSLRTEAVFQSLGEVAGRAAALALTRGVGLHDLTGADVGPLVRVVDPINPIRVLTLAEPATNGQATTSAVAGWTLGLRVSSEFYSTGYANDQGASKGAQWAMFKPAFGGSGRFRLRLNAPVTPSSQPKFRVEVRHANGLRTFYIDHKLGESYFVDIGAYDFSNDGTEFVRCTNAGDPTVPGSSAGTMNIDALAWDPA
jgi:hypothetical protein